MFETIEYKWTDGNNEDFKKFYLITEEYYSSIVGGKSKREAFIPYNISDSSMDVVIAYWEAIAIGCAGLKKYSDTDVEIKRVWVVPEYRGKHVASELMKRIEWQARVQGYERTILQTRECMEDAVILYKKRGYKIIKNYPPYDTLEGAICFAKKL